MVSHISAIATILWSAVNASLVPFTFEKVETGNTKSINRIVIPIIGAYGVICVSVTLIAPEVLMILAPKDYYEGVYAVPPIAATAFSAALYNIYANIEFYYKKTWWIALSTIISALINVGLNFIFIPQYGYSAAAYTTLVSHLALAFMHYLGCKYICKSTVYNTRAVFVISLITVVFCILCSFLYINCFLRYGVVIGAIIVLLHNRTKLATLYRELKQR